MRNRNAALSADQLAFSSIFSGGCASAAVALSFLLIDAARGDSLFTPSLMGSVMLLGQTPSEVFTVRLDMVALYSILHFFAFAALGTAATFAYAASGAMQRQPLLLVAALFSLLTVGAGIVDTFAFPGLVQAIDPVAVAAANAIAASVMAWFIHTTATDQLAEDVIVRDRRS